MIFLYILLIFAILILSVLLFMQQQVFGKTPSGERLKRIQNSPNYKKDKFENQSFTPDLVEGYTYWDILKKQIKKVEEKEPKNPIPSIKTDLKNIQSKKPVIIWFGHSSYFIQIAGKKILIDPVFSGFASPVPIGVKNFKGSNEYTIEDFPELDLLIISHDHYDHLDYKTLKKLHPKVKKVMTSLGTGEHLVHWGYDEKNITELDWWETYQFDENIHFTSTPARHFSGRGFARGKAFWSSFVLKTADYQLFLGGDSGMDSHFEEIGKKFGKFDLVILECGQYNEMWRYIHAFPEDSITIAKQLNAKMLLPVHWAKFALAQHPWKESIERITSEAKKQNQLYTTPKIGEMVILGEQYPNQHWWDNV